MPQLTPTTTYNDAVRRIAQGDVRAASVIAMLFREKPQNIMGYLHAMDNGKLYGKDIADRFWKECDGDMAAFLRTFDHK